MSKKVMRRTAADNPYLHKDFHGAMNVGIEYIGRHYGVEGVVDYLRRFVFTYHAPLRAELEKGRLQPLRDYLLRIYRAEGADFILSGDDNELVLELKACPALAHLRKRGLKPSSHFSETTRTVYKALCEDTPFVFALADYDPVTGSGRLSFRRRQP